MKKEKLVFIELLRIIACFSVIVNHTVTRLLYENQPSLMWFTSLTYFFMSKIAVPVFVMIAAYNMLDRQETYKKAFSRIIRIGICLIFFSAIYYVSFYYFGEIGELSIKDFIARIIAGPITNAYWYLYLYLGILLMLPFLQKMLINLNKTDFHVYFAISGLFLGIWPILVHYIPRLAYSKYFMIPVFNSYLCMLFLGVYLKRYGKISQKWIILSILIFAMVNIFNVGATYHEYVLNQGEAFLFLDNRELFPIVMASFCVFYFVSTLRFGSKVTSILNFLGNLTFGIYLFSDLIMKRSWFVYDGLIGYGIHPFVAMITFEVYIFVMGAVVTFILKKLPIFKNLM